MTSDAPFCEPVSPKHKVIALKRGDEWIIDLSSLAKYGYTIVCDGKEVSYTRDQDTWNLIVSQRPELFVRQDSKVVVAYDKNGETMSKDDYRKARKDNMEDIDRCQFNNDVEGEVRAQIEKRRLDEMTPVYDIKIHYQEVEVEEIPYHEGTPFITDMRNLTGDFFSRLGRYAEAAHFIHYMSGLLEADGYQNNKTASNGYHYFDFSSNSERRHVSFYFPGGAHESFSVSPRRSDTVDVLERIKADNEQKWGQYYSRWKVLNAKSVDSLTAAEVMSRVNIAIKEISYIIPRNKKAEDRKLTALARLRDIEKLLKV